MRRITRVSVLACLAAAALGCQVGSDLKLRDKISDIVNKVNVESVSVSPATASIREAETIQLTAAVKPGDATDKAVAWSSSASACATVSSTGLVTAVAAGSATITATTADGAKTASCAVTVARAAYMALPSGVETSLAHFNGKAIYMIFASQPASKPESDSGPVGTVAYSFTSKAAGASLSILPPSKNGLGALGDRGDAFSGGAALVPRSAIATGGPSKASRNIPTAISVGTAWTGARLGWLSYTINATCRYVSGNVYIFVDDIDTSAMSAYLPAYGSAFDSILSTLRARFGDESDVDSNGKIVVLFSHLLTGLGYNGYFYAHDKYPASTYADSNVGDIVYLTTDSAQQGEEVKRAFAHSLQHMIYFDQHKNRGITDLRVWLNEALSQAAEYYAGYTTSQLINMATYLNVGFGGLSLTHWQEAASQYGYVALFIRYVIDRFGDAAVKSMCSTDKVGIAAVESATGQDFNTLFNDFLRALVMSGTGDSSDPRYSYSSLDLKAIQPKGRGGLVTSLSIAAGSSYSGGFYPYRIFFINLTGAFGSLTSTGADFGVTAMGLSR